MKEYMTLMEVAKTYGRCYSTVYAAARNRKLNAKIVDGEYRVTPEDAAKWRDVVCINKAPVSMNYEKLGTLHIKIPVVMLDKLHGLAAAKKVSLSEYCRMTLNNQITKEEE